LRGPKLLLFLILLVVISSALDAATTIYALNFLPEPAFAIERAPLTAWMIAQVSWMGPLVAGAFLTAFLHLTLLLGYTFYAALHHLLSGAVRLSRALDPEVFLSVLIVVRFAIVGINLYQIAQVIS